MEKGEEPDQDDSEREHDLIDVGSTTLLQTAQRVEVSGTSDTHSRQGQMSHHQRSAPTIDQKFAQERLSLKST